jgi:putative oxidoreductase
MTTLSLPHARSASAPFTATRLATWGLTVLRVGAGALFLQHGLQKLFGAFGGMGAPGAAAPLMSQMGLAGVLETGGGLLLILGLLTRPVAFVLLAEMLYAFLTVHAPKGGVPLQNGGELALLYAIIFTFLGTNGSGPLSLDRVLFRPLRRGDA